MLRIVYRSINHIIPLLLLLLCGCKAKERSLPFYNTPDFTATWLKTSQSPTPVISHRVGNFSFMDQEGKTVSGNNLRGKIHVANFMFTSCASICPKMTANLKTVQTEFLGNKNVQLISYSVTPWKDSVPVLSRYAKRFGIDAGSWHLLTGATSEIYTLARQSYFAEEQTGFQKDSTEFLHTEHVLLVDRDGYLRGVYNGTQQLEMERLRGDIRELLREN